jgi:hypothetical protein
MTVEKTVSRSNDADYGSVANGTQVGSGYDVEVKRMSPTEAIVNVMTPTGSEDFLTLIEVEPDTDLQELALEYGRFPNFSEVDYVSREDDPDDQWDDLAATWNSINVIDAD